MDSFGLLAAWISVASFLFAVLAAIASHLLSRPYQRWWAKTSVKRSEKRLQQLLAYGEIDAHNPGTGYVAELVSLYGSAILNLVAAIGLVIVSLVILDLGPSIIAAATLPFNISTKWLSRGIGVLMLVIGYFFIFRLCYLGIQIRRRGRAYSEEISTLKERLGKGHATD